MADINVKSLNYIFNFLKKLYIALGALYGPGPLYVSLRRPCAALCRPRAPIRGLREALRGPGPLYGGLRRPCAALCRPRALIRGLREAQGGPVPAPGAPGALGQEP